MLPARSKNSKKIDLAGKRAVRRGTVGKIVSGVAGLGSTRKYPKK